MLIYRKELASLSIANFIFVSLLTDIMSILFP